MSQNSVPAHANMNGLQKEMKLAQFPNELLLGIVEYLPDVDSLINFGLSHFKFYALLKAHQNILADRVLRNEISEDIYLHARTAYLAQHLFMPNLDKIDVSAIYHCVNSIGSIRDNAMSSKCLITEAKSISEIHRKVMGLTSAFFRECPHWRKQTFAPLQNSLANREPSESERVRVQQAIYLFEILRRLCNNMYISKGKGQAYYIHYSLQTRGLQASLMENVFAPWEMHQVLAIQAFFRRALHGFSREESLSDGVMPALLSNGIDFIHEAICGTQVSNRDDFLRFYEDEARQKPLCGFGMVLSRGYKQTWTRKNPKPLETYKPFAGSRSAHGVPTWKNIELKQKILGSSDPFWADMFDYDVKVWEGRFDLWSAALWDEERWKKDIEPTFRRPEPACWKGIREQCDPDELGDYISGDPHIHWMAYENVQG